MEKMFGHDYTKRPNEVVLYLDPLREHCECCSDTGRLLEVCCLPGYEFPKCRTTLRKYTKQSVMLPSLIWKFYFWKTQCILKP